MDTDPPVLQLNCPNSRRAAGDGMSERARQAVENCAGFFDVLARWTSPDLPAPLALPDLPDLEVAA
jgi:hypothetical protein